MIITTQNTFVTVLCFFFILNFGAGFKIVEDTNFVINGQRYLDSQVDGPVTPYDEAKSKQYAYFSMISHCTDTQITQWNCKLCKNVTLTDVAVINNQTYNIYGFVGYSKSLNQIIVSWRGSVDIKNWEVDLKFRLTKYTPRNGTCTDCQVHSGVYQGYRSVESQVNNHIKSLLAKYPTATLTSTGHSLGGGLSLFTAL